MHKEGRKKQARSNKQQGKAIQHTQGSHFLRKNELPRVGFKPTILCTLDRICSAQLAGPTTTTQYIYTCTGVDDLKDREFLQEC